MIVRRLVEALQRQDWGTVLIEFLIVVVGIFVGLQVSNWNEARIFANQERAYLQQLRDEIRGNINALSYRADYTQAVVDGGRRALAVLERGDGCAPRCAEFLVDLFHASQVWGTPLSTASYQELQRLGLPSNVALRDQVGNYYRYIAGWDTVNELPPPFRENVRGHFPPEVFEHLWTGCYETDRGTSEIEIVTFNCVDALEADVDTEAVARRVAADLPLRDQLRFWIGQNLYATTYFPEMRALAEQAIDAIEAELAGGFVALDETTAR